MDVGGLQNIIVLKSGQGKAGILFASIRGNPVSYMYQQFESICYAISGERRGVL